MQGDPYHWQRPPFDLVLEALAADWLLLYLPAAQAGWRNIQNQSQQEVFTIVNGHPLLL